MNDDAAVRPIYSAILGALPAKRACLAEAATPRRRIGRSGDCPCVCWMLCAEPCASRWRVPGRVCRLGGTRPRCRDTAASSGPSGFTARSGGSDSTGRWSRRWWARRSQPVRAGRAGGLARTAGSSDACDRRDAAQSSAGRLAPLAAHIQRWGYSPLNQINRNTVKDLKVAWTWSLNSGPGAVNEFTPLVHDGIMFMWNFGETIQALDAKTGTLLWQYTHDLPKDYPSLPGFFRTKRNLAIGGNKVIVPTIDMRSSRWT